MSAERERSAAADIGERRMEERRRRMVREHVAGRGISDRRVLEAMAEVPRHRFVREHLRRKAYGDHALPIEGGQTISQPWVVARMTELLAVGPDHKVLEVGTGSGYQTAILAKLGRWVYSLERVPGLAKGASMGWAEAAPFDRILVTAGAPAAPEPLLGQLAAGGRLLIPEGDRTNQRLVLYRRTRDGLVREELDGVAFVPLVGRFGWRE